jgi:hypothetical protein
MGQSLFLKLEYTKTSVGAYNKDLIKEHPCKANRPRKEVSLHTLGGRGSTLLFISSHSTSSTFNNSSSQQTETINNNLHN